MSEPGSKRTFRCPRCGKEFTCASVAAHKPFPFCSSRCRDVDLGNWLIGKYAIPGAPASAETSEAEEEEEREEKEEEAGFEEPQAGT